MSVIIHDIQQACVMLSNAEIVAIPTETVYGLAANALNDSAISKIYALKKRPLTHPLIMHVSQAWDLHQWVTFIPDYAISLMEKLWPGPLTLILPLKPNSLSSLVTGGQQTVAIRCPQHPVAQTVLTTLGFPLVAPSANPFGQISPTTAEHVKESFPDEPLFILDGGRCQLGIESTIVDATHIHGLRILRNGMIGSETIELNSCGAPLLTDKLPSIIRAPGLLDKHYQPQKPLHCFADKQKMLAFCKQNPASYVLSFSKDTAFAAWQGCQLPHSAQELAFELYYQLRAADNTPQSLIVMELPPDEPAFASINERLLKAGICHI